MKLTEIQPATLVILAATPALAALPRISQLDPDYNAKFDAALIEPGLFIVTAQMGGKQLSGFAGKPVVRLDNELLVIVVENEKSNATGMPALVAVEHILEALHFATYLEGASTKNRFEMSEPAYERGPVARGITSWLCPFRINSLNTIKSA